MYLLSICLFVWCSVASAKEFHEGLHEDDLLHYFGTRNKRMVPEYEIIRPSVMSQGRMRRSADDHDDEPVEYHLKAFGEEYHLKLKKNNQLVAPGCIVETLGANGTRSQARPCVESSEDHCYYLGHSARHEGSKAAVSTCKGLQGLISTKTHDLILQPVKNQHVPRVRRHVPFDDAHIAYKRLPRKKSCNVKETAHSTGKSHHRRSRRSTSTKYVEMMVVSDTEMWRFHGSDIRRYVLTALNVAAQRYRDPSLGTEIILSVVRLIIMEQPQSGLQVTRDASITLNSFCKWQEGFNPKSDEDPMHADGATLLTRLDIHHRGAEQTTGLAMVGGMCVDMQRCSYNEDTGIDVGLTVAHQIGHNLGMNHDGANSGCADFKNIMATDGGSGSTSFEWSRCSARHLQEFLGEEKAKCLNDRPSGTAHKLVESNPGLIYDADKQCRYFQGDGSTFCEMQQLYQKFGDQCSRLVCHNTKKPGYCTAGQAPIMDGTACGTRKWCKRGTCVPYGSGGPSPINGGWRQWDANWSQCSRSCGGGVMVKRRHCDNPAPQHGGSHCLGNDVMAELCNPKTCSTSQYQFKLEQCAVTNGQPFKGQHYKWEPFLQNTGDKSCELHCLATGAEFYALRGNNKYKDGTECTADGSASSFGRCVDTQCQGFGCDGKMDSGKVYDRCGICDGEGDTCAKKSGTYTKGTKDVYVKFLSIPNGATGILITNKNTYSNMAVKVNGQFIFNSNGRSPDRSGSYSKDGITVVYKKTPETIQITGPITKPLEVLVWREYNDTYMGVEPDIAYEYYTKSSVHVNSTNKWVSSYGSCSKTCGTGQKHVEVRCVRNRDSTQVADHYCNFNQKPDSHAVTCDTQLCPQQWKAGAFGACSRTCGGGQMRRNVKCIRQNRGMEEVIHDVSCKHLYKPAAEAECNPDICLGLWITGAWSSCSLTCGKGKKIRHVKCYNDSDSDVLVPDSSCLAEKKPLSSDTCLMNVCSATASTARATTVVSSNTCTDVKSDFNTYESVCTKYSDWARKNCQKHCKFCRVASGGGQTECEDKSNCAAYDTIYTATVSTGSLLTGLTLNLLLLITVHMCLHPRLCQF